MLDGLLGRGFTSKCKSLIKLLKARIDLIRRKRNAMQKFLKKDIADLLSNGLDTNAYPRAEGLLVEMNLSSCYDVVEQFCDCILKQISFMQKQSECPEECREAVPSLIFAAARFADLPELRDLRQLFSQRYGNSLEPFLSQEFAEKMAAKHPTGEKKLQLMRDIAKEFSIKWDSKALEEKLFNPPASVQGQHKKQRSFNDNNNGYKLHHDMEDTVPKKDIQDVYKLQNEREDTISKRDNHDVSSCEWQEITNDRHKPHGNREDGLLRRDHPDLREASDAGYKEKRDNLDGVEVTPSPPKTYVPVAGSNQNHLHLINKVNEETTEILKPFCDNVVPPPYVKPRGSKYGTNSKAQENSSDNNEASSDSTYSNRDVMRNRSERTEKKLDHVDYGAELVGPARVNGHGDEKDHHWDDLIGDEMPRPKSVRRKLKPPPGHDNIGNSRQEEKRNLDNRKERRGPQTTFDDDCYSKDEEDEMMDELLLYYSKKKPSTNEPSKMRGVKAPQTNDTATGTSRSPGHRSRDEAHLQLNTGLSNPLGRAASLPLEPTTPTEKSTAPARASSFQPDGQAGHVHPKLPQYDDLAARIAALRMT